MPDDSTVKGDEELDNLPPQEGDAEKCSSLLSKPLSKVVKEQKGLKTYILYKYYIFCINTMKSTKKVYINLIKSL